MGGGGVLGLFVIVAVLYGLTFTHGLDNGILSGKDLKMRKYLTLC